MKETYEMLIQNLLERDFASVDNWFTAEEINGLRKALFTRYDNDDFQPAKIGNGSNEQRIETIRKDKIFWLDPEHCLAPVEEFFAKIDGFVNYLNRTCYAGIQEFEFHFALYEPGSFYKRHVDQFNDDDKRKFSIVLYLNNDWQQGDGGELMIYRNSKDHKIEPIAGRLLFFKSELEHEVLMAHQDRISVTGWLKTR